ncbi:hypothetical protein [Aurantibacillus circumpalustris]|uniref:hypothetical protein n=1 Tax=Aurantibacillus circumpalustris TaxID=3036359 RepID=UPI00295A8C0B|nr:hypothetical protein [Aurantibacillus circumpalustris]
MKTTATINLKTLNAFLNKFPDDAKCWSKATDELPDLYYWMTQFYNEMNYENPAVYLKPVGRYDCKTPSERNTKYKLAIREAFKKFNESHKKSLTEAYGHWFKLAA